MNVFFTFAISLPDEKGRERSHRKEKADNSISCFLNRGKPRTKARNKNPKKKTCIHKNEKNVLYGGKKTQCNKQLEETENVEER